MQCFIKDEDLYLDAENAFFLLPFCLVHLSLASLACCVTYFTFLSGVFIVFSCRRYPSQHRYDFCAQIDICVVAVYRSLHNFGLSPCNLFMLSVFRI